MYLLEKRINIYIWIKSSKKPQIKKFHKTDPPKSGNSDSKYNFKIFKTKNQTKKMGPRKFQKVKNIYKEASNQNVV